MEKSIHGLALVLGFWDRDSESITLARYDLTADGLTITGTGINPDGQTEAWVATLPGPAIPVADAGKDLHLADKVSPPFKRRGFLPSAPEQLDAQGGAERE